MPEVLCIQETWNHKGQKELKIPGYAHAAAYRRQKDQKGGSVAIFVIYGIDFFKYEIKKMTTQILKLRVSKFMDQKIVQQL